MTVIAWDGSILAADKMMSNQGMKSSTTKVIPFEDYRGKMALAVTGNLAFGLMLREWFIHGEQGSMPALATPDDWARLIVATPSEVFMYETYPERIYIEDEIHAWGSGRDFALGAMHMGADAIVAVEVASKLSTECGLGFDFVKVRGLK